MSKGQELLQSRRFWMTIGSLVFMTTNQYGLQLDEQTVISVVIAIAAWVVGDSLRSTGCKKHD